MPLSLNEIRERARAFAKEWAGGSFSELAAKIGEAVKASKIMGEGLASEEDAPEETDEGNG